GTHVILVEMPITDLNRSILQKPAWNAYRTGLQKLASDYGATFLNLEDSDKFSTSDFGDTVHLHSRGGRKLLDTIAGVVSQDVPTRAALKLPAAGNAAVAQTSGRAL